MPSSSDTQHRFWGAMMSHPTEARARGISAATAAEWLRSDRGKPWQRRDDGGAVDPTTGGIGGMTPSVNSMNPMKQGMVQRYSSIPTEKLQELASRTAGTQQGQVVQSLLRQRQMQPNAQLHQQQAQSQQQGQPWNPAAGAQQQVARGGGIAARAAGGDMGVSMSEADPWWTRQDSNQMASGYLHGSTLGRADNIKTQAPAGAYVIPADVVAGLGEGNSLAGARIMQEAVSTGPWGTPVSHGGRGLAMPHPQARVPQAEAKGGTLSGAGPVPVRLSHGEFVVLPEDVQRIGGDDLKHGHHVLDHFVETQRAKQIKKLQSLPGPVKSQSRAAGGGIARRGTGGDLGLNGGYVEPIHAPGAQYQQMAGSVAGSILAGEFGPGAAYAGGQLGGYGAMLPYDLAAGYGNAAGYDMSSTMPGGSAPGWGGVANASTGLPLYKSHGGRIQRGIAA